MSKRDELGKLLDLAVHLALHDDDQRPRTVERLIDKTAAHFRDFTKGARFRVLVEPLIVDALSAEKGKLISFIDEVLKRRRRGKPRRT